ncbi:MAG: hypothetical protein V4632_02340, partial [Pseudomonadota bacterium]
CNPSRLSQAKYSGQQCANAGIHNPLAQEGRRYPECVSQNSSSTHATAHMVCYFPPGAKPQLASQPSGAPAMCGARIFRVTDQLFIMLRETADCDPASAGTRESVLVVPVELIVFIAIRSWS